MEEQGRRLILGYFKVAVLVLFYFFSCRLDCFSLSYIYASCSWRGKYKRGIISFLKAYQLIST